MVVLELTYLYEVNRIQDPASTIIKELEDTIGISISAPNFNLLINKAIQIEWTRDPFDRLITAEAAMNDTFLVSADKIIRKHYSKTVW